jgi:hypothetical protein
MRPSVAIALTTATTAIAANNVHVSLQTSFNSAPFLVELLLVPAYCLYDHGR